MGHARPHAPLAGSWFAGSLTLLSMFGTAASADGEPSAICDPARVVCQAAEGAPLRAVRLELLRTSVDEAARASELGAETELATGPAAGKLDAEALLLRARVREVGRRVDGFEPAMREVFDGVREAARRVVARDPRLDEVSRAGALERLDRVQLRWVDTAGLLREPMSPLHVGLVRGCGETLLEDDGWISRNWQELVVCPGFVLLEAERAGGSARATADAAAFLIAHELGHVVEMTANDAPSEAAADLWANAVLADYVASRVAHGDDGHVLTARALGSFCDLDDDGMHGAGVERAARAAAAVSEAICL